MIHGPRSLHCPSPAVGVSRGLYSEQILTTWKAGRKYYLVDPWTHQEDYVDWANTPQEEQDKTHAEAMERLKPFGAGARYKSGGLGGPPRDPPSHALQATASSSSASSPTTPSRSLRTARSTSFTSTRSTTTTGCVRGREGAASALVTAYLCLGTLQALVDMVDWCGGGAGRPQSIFLAPHHPAPSPGGRSSRTAASTPGMTTGTLRWVRANRRRNLRALYGAR